MRTLLKHKYQLDLLIVYRVEHVLTEREVQEMTNACSTLLEEYNSIEVLKKID